VISWIGLLFREIESHHGGGEGALMSFCSLCSGGGSEDGRCHPLFFVCPLPPPPPLLGLCTAAIDRSVTGMTRSKVLLPVLCRLSQDGVDGEFLHRGERAVGR
jgi:hypothetical protein